MSTVSMSAFGGKADILISRLMSANDPKRTQGRRRFLGSAESHLDKFRYAPCFSEVTIA